MEGRPRRCAYKRRVSTLLEILDPVSPLREEDGGATVSTLLEILGRDSALACYIAFQVAFQPFLRFWPHPGDHERQQHNSCGVSTLLEILAQLVTCDTAPGVRIRFNPS